MTLNLDPNLTDADDVYQALLDAHDGLTKDESDAFNARLILILCNHIGSSDTVRAALRASQFT